MRILLILAVMLFSVHSAFADEVFVDIPVNILVEGGCNLSTPDYSGSTPGIWVSASDFKSLDNDYTISYNCSPGTNFNIQFNYGGTTTISAIKGGISTKKIAVKFYKDSTDVTNQGSIASGTGDGTDKTVVLSPKVKYDMSGNACTQSGSIYTCENGNYTKNIVVRASW